jgi:hypothetical protein
MAIKEEDMVVPRGKVQPTTNGASEEVESAPAAVEPALQEIVDSYEKTLAGMTKLYEAQIAEIESAAKASEAAPLIAGPVSTHFGVRYQWWNLLVLGPFQRVAPLGPFRPSKIIRHGEDAWMVVALWRNPRPLPGGPNPSASQIMAPFRYRIRGEMINLSSVSNGPDFAPITGTFGGGFTNIHTVRVPAVRQPTDGQPDLYEVNFTVDILGPGPGLPPFAGFATWVFDPDVEPPFVLPRVLLPDGRVLTVRVPGTSAGLEHDTPARFLVYT